MIFVVIFNLIYALLILFAVLAYAIIVGLEVPYSGTAETAASNKSSVKFYKLSCWRSKNSV